MYAGCVSGAISKDEYIRIINAQGFRGVTIHKEKEIVLPDEMMLKYLSAEELKVFRDSGTGIFSITISGSK